MTARKYRLVTKACKGCERKMTGHPNKRFCCQRCKDRYWNAENPRGYGLEREIDRDDRHTFDMEH